MKESNVSKESAQKIVGSAEKKVLKARLLKLKLAGLHTPRFPSTSEARRGLIQSNITETNKKMTQSRLEKERDFINTSKPIRPTGEEAKIDSSIRRKLAKLKEQKIAQDHNHKIVFRGYKNNAFKSASLESSQGQYVKYWLLNAKQTNGNGWGISTKNAAQNMQQFVGMPLVVTSSHWHGASVYGESYEHPFIPTNDMNQILAHQAQFKVGTIIKVAMNKDGDYHAEIKMLPKFAGMTLPPFCSPAIYQLDAMEEEGNLSKWKALHLAALDENPAYGARIAILKGTCMGTAQSCSVQFKSAKLATTIMCPVLKAKKLKLKLKISALRSDTNKAVDIVNVAGVKKKKKKLHERLATLGEENMTFQDSKKIKILKKKHPEVRKAQGSVEDMLRSSGRSVDGSHTTSSFLSSTGDFIGAGGESHINQIKKIMGTGGAKTNIDDDRTIDDFSGKHNLPRVQNFQVNRAGEKQLSFGINSRINRTQLKSIMDLEKGGATIGFAVNKGESVGKGTRDLTKALREHKFLGAVIIPTGKNIIDLARKMGVEKTQRGKGFTFLPKENKIVDAFSPEGAQQLLKKFPGKGSLALISRTTGIDKLGGLESGLDLIGSEGSEALIGGFNNPKTNKFEFDASFARRFNNNDDIQKELQKTNQFSSLVISEDGSVNELKNPKFKTPESVRNRISKLKNKLHK